ncbi:hypothetical protein E2C01_021664 [Portunus trituberculatus]|uniref:Uncharacterized protein n=1 Tax=Portunus trituberculatus TaxID=210409 RepID=A0A5B7E3Y4_PORTR|nr:hypothetical protein [Portunus trituberculatus]
MSLKRLKSHKFYTINKRNTRENPANHLCGL